MNLVDGDAAMTEYTKFRNKNRGYMKLEVWQKSIELYKLVWKTVYVDIMKSKTNPSASWKASKPSATTVHDKSHRKGSRRECGSNLFDATCRHFSKIIIPNFGEAVLQFTCISRLQNSIAPKLHDSNTPKLQQSKSKLKDLRI
jgi:hypothetical protein